VPDEPPELLVPWPPLLEVDEPLEPVEPLELPVLEPFCVGEDEAPLLVDPVPAELPQRQPP
jgi:hypothetical protein